MNLSPEVRKVLLEDALWVSGFVLFLLILKLLGV